MFWSFILKIKQLNLIFFAFKCLMIGLIVFGTISLYVTIMKFNEKLEKLEADHTVDQANIYFLDQRIGNCFPND